ncbi:MAG: DUF4388 domain-containing protein [Chloroflexota bacterium]|nr:DUF4388 domain-containing protein [Chloroflexota bacterium]
MELTQAQSEFDLQGRLGNFAISDILQMIGFSGKSGVLTLIQGWNTRTITFDQGRIAYVASGARLPSMFDLLVRTGRLQRFQVDGFRERRPGKTEEEMLAELVHRKLLSRADIERCNELLLETSVYTLFLWRNCIYTFKAGEREFKGGVHVSVDGNHLIIEGTRRVDEWISISPVVPSVFLIFRRTNARGAKEVPDHLREVYDLVDSHRDVAAISREANLSQFEAAKALYDLTTANLTEALPPNKQKVCELYNLAVESIYLKLVLFDYSRDALMFENQLNRFAIENKLRVRMASGKIIRSDLETPISATELVDLYKLFIAIQNNQFGKTYEPKVAQGLLEGLYLSADPELKQMMRMYEFIEIEGLLFLDMFNKRRLSMVNQTDQLGPPKIADLMDTGSQHATQPSGQPANQSADKLARTSHLRALTRTGS